MHSWNVQLGSDIFVVGLNGLHFLVPAPRSIVVSMHTQPVFGRIVISVHAQFVTEEK